MGALAAAASWVCEAGTRDQARPKGWSGCKCVTCAACSHTVRLPTVSSCSSVPQSATLFVHFLHIAPLSTGRFVQASALMRSVPRICVYCPRLWQLDKNPQTVPGCVSPCPPLGNLFKFIDSHNLAASQRHACSPSNRTSSQTCKLASDAAHRGTVSIANAVRPPAHRAPGPMTARALSWPWRPAQPGTRPRGARARTGCTPAGRRPAAARPCRSTRAAGTCTCVRVRARRSPGSALRVLTAIRRPPGIMARTQGAPASHVTRRLPETS